MKKLLQLTDNYPTIKRIIVDILTFIKFGGAK